MLNGTREAQYNKIQSGIMMEIDKKFITKLLSEAAENPRLRQNYDLRTSSDDNSQRMLNALLPGTVVPIHRHPHSTENVLLLHGKLVEVLYEEERPGDGIEQKPDKAIGRRLHETARIVMDPSSGSYGCVVPAGTWHTVEVRKHSIKYDCQFD